MKMKRIAIPLLAAVVALLAACDSALNTKPYDKFSEDMVWSSRANAEAFVYQTYADVMGLYTGNGAISIPEAWTANSASFDGINGNANPVYRELVTRDYDAGFNQFGRIRRCNLILEKVTQSALSTEEKQLLTAEAKFLRAMVYFHIARRTGRFVWVDRVLTPADADNLKLPAVESVARAYEYILKDLNDAIEGLPETSLPGRISRYGAIAFKAEVALQAAAYTGNRSYYQMTVDAAKLVIPRYSLESEYGAMFNEKKPLSPEIIFGVYYDPLNTVVSGTIMINMMPNNRNDFITRYGGSPALKSETTFEGWLEHFPSQNLTDQYLVIDEANPALALRWDQTSQFRANVAKVTTGLPKNVVDSGVVTSGKRFNDIIYANRDRRFYETVVHDSSQFFGETITTCIKGNFSRWLKLTGVGYYVSYTNYYWRKGLYNVNPRVYHNIATSYHYVLMRLGRVYLNMAEAYLQLGMIPEAVAALNQTRVTHGGLPPSTAATSAEAWADYKRERRVELALEGDYYWSLLRWGKYGGDANAGRTPGGVSQELDEEVPYYIDIAKNRKAYTIGIITENQLNERKFYTRRYLFPIPYGQIQRNENLTQNEGW